MVPQPSKLIAALLLAGIFGGKSPFLQIQTSPEWAHISNGVLNGVVFDDEHHPVGGLLIHAHFHQTESQSIPRAAVTGQDGTFKIVLPAGNYLINKPYDLIGRCSNRGKSEGCLWFYYPTSSGSTGPPGSDAIPSSYKFSKGSDHPGSHAKIEIVLRPRGVVDIW